MLRGTSLVGLLLQQTALLGFTFLLAMWVEYGVIGLLAAQQGIAVTYLPEYISLIAEQSLWVDCSCTVGIYLSGPLVAFALGMVILGLFRYYGEGPAWLRMLGILLGLQLVFRLLVGFGAGIVAEEGLWYSMAWLYWPKPLQILVASMGGLGIVLLGFIFRKRWYTALAYTQPYLKKRQSFRDTLVLGVLPAVMAGVPFLFLYGWQKYEWYQLGLFAAGWLLFFLPVALAQRSLESDGFLLPDEDEDPPYRFHWWLVLFAVVGAALLWWML